MPDLEHLATVVAWDDATGAGRFSDDVFGREQDFERSIVTGADTLVVGQRIIYSERLYPTDDGGSPWRTVEVRHLDSDAAYWAAQLDELCRAVEHADSDLNVALEVASEDTVEGCRDTLARVTERRHEKAVEIAGAITGQCVSHMTGLPGFGTTIYANGMEQALRIVVDQVDPQYRSDVLLLWRGMLAGAQESDADLEEIRAMD